VARSYEHGNESFVSIKGDEIFSMDKRLVACPEELCFMDYVNYILYNESNDNY
jgi:hypothetical protein